MPSTTSATDPLSDYEALSTLWAAARSARGTDLRGKSLVNLDVLTPVPQGFIAEPRSKLRPAGIEYGFGQAGSAEPEPVPPTKEDHRLTLQPNGPRGLEGDPPQGLSAPPSRPLAAGVPGEGELLAYRLHGVRVQAEKLAAAAGEIDQIEARGPAPVVAASGALDFAAIVPDPAHRPSLSSAAARANESAPPPRPERRGFRRGEIR